MRVDASSSTRRDRPRRRLRAPWRRKSEGARSRVTLGVHGWRFSGSRTTLGFTSDGHGVVRTLISTLGRRRHEPRRSRRFCVGGRRVGSVVTTMIDDDRAVEGQTKGDIYGQFRTLSRRVSGREKIRQTRDYFTAPRRLPEVRDRGWMEFSARARRAISTSVRRTRVVGAGRRALANARRANLYAANITNP